MSSLTRYLVILLVGLLTVHCVPHAQSKNSTPDLSNVWGKGRGPIQAQIVELASSARTGEIELEGQIKTSLESFQVEWVLPQGVTLVSGTLKETITPSEPQEVITRKITVRVGTLGKKTHIVFFPHIEKNGQRVGQSRVYNLRPSAEDAERTEDIKKMMKSRNSSPIR